MTSNAHYRSEQASRTAYGTRTNAPLPSLPSPDPLHSPYGPVSPVSYHDRENWISTPSQSRLSPMPSHSPYTREEHDGDVPLRPYNTKRESSNSQHRIFTPAEDSDPLVRDTKTQERDHERNREGLYSQDEQGWFRGRITWVCFIFSIIQISVFVAELARMGILTGSPIQTKPSVNPMIGPSPYVLIEMGARYQPCMHDMPLVNETISWPCPNTTTIDDNTPTCTLAQLCGFNGLNVPSTYGRTGQDQPNQWFRFVTPIFLHAGIIHIGFNLLLQLTIGRDMELAIGSLRFLLVYLSAGIFGFVLGGNFAANGIASTGASGSLFGVLALNLLDLLYWWHTRRSPLKDLAFIIIDIVIAFVLGLLPGLDNFSHIGGFLMGLVLGVCILRSPPALSRRLGEELPAGDVGYLQAAALRHDPARRKRDILRQPMAFFRDRQPLWWAWWLIRALALIGTIVGFIILLKNFYVWHRACSWCRYLSCINVSNWCDIGNLVIQQDPAKSPARLREL